MEPKLAVEAVLGTAPDPTLEYRFANLRRRGTLPAGWTDTGKAVGELSLLSKPLAAPRPTLIQRLKGAIR